MTVMVMIVMASPLPKGRPTTILARESTFSEVVFIFRRRFRACSAIDSSASRYAGYAPVMRKSATHENCFFFQMPTCIRKSLVRKTTAMAESGRRVRLRSGMLDFSFFLL